MNKALRLTNSASFNYIYRNGTALSSPILVLFYVKAAGLKFGVSVSKKVGGSVARNKAKRRIREAIRKILPRLGGNYNYVISAREGIADASFDDILGALLSLFEKAGHLKA
ncbi:MAG: ribonuclease P protein component [Clostridiales bacterium]|jgi:ribonuclease P protein component|nr:ribonuclease P protein component [Clostridiales bacterium]HOB63765.1 ribonuclease P protein component [Clostridia bacterium]HOK82065.1 ribonuclease P protein component [Clostridia bacterium]HOL61295.1 ribonuclease P protein component [Clostridia bacterium]HPO53640.1 ribonuclease P protein component [Clostridia bacterium]